MAWDVVCKPRGKNPGLLKKATEQLGITQDTHENLGGMIIYLVNGTSEEEVSRVAFIRRAGLCKNPDVTFKDQLAVEIAKAREAAKTMNGFTTDAAEML